MRGPENGFGVRERDEAPEEAFSGGGGGKGADAAADPILFGLAHPFEASDRLDTRESWTTFACKRSVRTGLILPDREIPVPVAEERVPSGGTAPMRRRIFLLEALAAFQMEVVAAQQREGRVVAAIQEGLKKHFSYVAVTLLKNEEDPLFRQICWPLRPDEEIDLKRSLIDGHVVAVSPHQVIFPLKHEALQSLLLLERLAEERISPEELDLLEQAARFCSVVLGHSRSFAAMEFEASRDPLTRLHNRRSFHRRLEEEMHRAIRYGQPLSLIMLDIDWFKRINDTFGHPVGDAVLSGIGRILLEVSRTNDVVARIGGEEFAVLLPSTDQAGAYRMAERMRGLVALRRFEKNGREIPVTISGGVATFDRRTPLSMEEFLRRADEALYRAKELGRNCVMVDGF